VEKAGELEITSLKPLFSASGAAMLVSTYPDVSIATKAMR